MTCFEQRLQAVLDAILEMDYINHIQGRGKTAGPARPIRPATPVATAPLTKFLKPPFNIDPAILQALAADPDDTDTFNQIAARHGKPIAGMIRRAVLGEPDAGPSPHDMR